MNKGTAFTSLPLHNCVTILSYVETHFSLHSGHMDPLVEGSLHGKWTTEVMQGINLPGSSVPNAYPSRMHLGADVLVLLC